MNADWKNVAAKMLLVTLLLIGAAWYFLNSIEINLDNAEQHEIDSYFEEVIKRDTGYVAEGIPNYMSDCKRAVPRVRQASCIKIGLIEPPGGISSSSINKVLNAVAIRGNNLIAQGKLSQPAKIFIKTYRSIDGYEGPLTPHSIQNNFDETGSFDINCQEGICK